MATKEQKLTELYHVDWKKNWFIIALVIFLFGEYLCFHNIKMINWAEETFVIPFVIGMIFWSRQEFEVIKRLNNRISDLEDQLAQKHS